MIGRRSLRRGNLRTRSLRWSCRISAIILLLPPSEGLPGRSRHSLLGSLPLLREEAVVVSGGLLLVSKNYYQRPSLVLFFVVPVVPAVVLITARPVGTTSRCRATPDAGGGGGDLLLREGSYHTERSLIRDPGEALHFAQLRPRCCSEYEVLQLIINGAAIAAAPAAVTHRGNCIRKR